MELNFQGLWLLPHLNNKCSLLFNDNDIDDNLINTTKDKHKHPVFFWRRKLSVHPLWLTSASLYGTISFSPTVTVFRVVRASKSISSRTYERKRDYKIFDRSHRGLCAASQHSMCAWVSHYAVTFDAPLVEAVSSQLLLALTQTSATQSINGSLGQSCIII